MIFIKAKAVMHRSSALEKQLILMVFGITVQTEVGLQVGEHVNFLQSKETLHNSTKHLCMAPSPSPPHRAKKENILRAICIFLVKGDYQKFLHLITAAWSASTSPF